MTTTWKWLRGPAGLESGRWCRNREESIHQSDQFGLSDRRPWQLALATTAIATPFAVFVP